MPAFRHFDSIQVGVFDDSPLRRGVELTEMRSSRGWKRWGQLWFIHNSTVPVRIGAAAVSAFAHRQVVEGPECQVVPP
jgi:hypothetical protein